MERRVSSSVPICAGTTKTARVEVFISGLKEIFI